MEEAQVVQNKFTNRTHWFYVLLAVIVIGGMWWAMTPSDTFQSSRVEDGGGICTSDTDCASGEFCRVGLCTNFTPKNACEKDSDCMLIDTTKRFACCTDAACLRESASSTIVAVQKEWFSSGRITYCLDPKSCNTSKACILPSGVGAASCVHNVCVVGKK